MQSIHLLIILLLALIGYAVWYLWRQRHPMPCPFYLAWLLDNPYMNSAAGSHRIIDHLEITSGMRVLDVGCGAGRLSMPMAQRVGPAGEVVAVDIQERLLEALGDRAVECGLFNITPVLRDISDGNLQADRFDRAVMVGALGEIGDPGAALKAVYASLKPGGLLSVTEVMPDPDYQPKQKVRRLCRDVGFRFVSLHGRWLAYTMVFRKPPVANSAG